MHFYNNPVKLRGEYCYLLTKEEAETQCLEVLYRNHIAIKWLSWNSDTSFSAQFRIYCIAAHISTMADSILPVSDDKNWK